MYNQQIDQINKAFKNIKNQIQNKNITQLDIEIIQEEEIKCISMLENIPKSKPQFQQISTIKNKYQDIKNIINSQKYTNNNKQLLSVLKNALIMKSKNQQNKSNSSDIRSSQVFIPDKSSTINNFFKKKQEQINNKDISFKKILDSKQISSIKDASVSKSVSKYSKSNIKKNEQKQQQAKILMIQQKKALTKLQQKIKQQEQLNEFQKNLLKQQKNRYLSKIQDLQKQIQTLYRQNYKLKQKQKHIQQSLQLSKLQQKSSSIPSYQPYVIKIQTNDLNQINQKNQKLKKQSNFKQSKYNQIYQSNDYLGNKLISQKPITAQQFFKKQPHYYNQQKYPVQQKQNNQNFILKQLLGQSFDQYPDKQIKNYKKQEISIDRGSHFDTFHMASTLSFVNSQMLNQSRKMTSITSQTSTRNKVAFFKQSLVLVRENDIEIAYKKSQLNQSMDKLRFIFYINNKSNNQKRVNIDYEYQQQYFLIQVIQKLTCIPAKTQARQVIQISLISHTDINGVTDVHLTIGNNIYDIWLPVGFMRFSKINLFKNNYNSAEMTILPDRQFSNFKNAQQILPLTFGGNQNNSHWSYTLGQSKFGSFPVKLSWCNRQLNIQTSQIWLDFLGFVLHYFK